MCCATTVKGNDAGESVECIYREIEIGMSIFMDDISVAEGPEEVKKKQGNVQKWKWKRK